MSDCACRKRPRRWCAWHWALIVVGLTACDEPIKQIPRKCSECDGLCAPFKAESCRPVQTYEQGKIIYVDCRCGPDRVSGGKP